MNIRIVVLEKGVGDASAVFGVQISCRSGCKSLAAFHVMRLVQHHAAAYERAVRR